MPIPARAANKDGTQVLLGAYEFVRELGRGAMGRVVLVRERRAAGEALYAAKIVPGAHARRLLWERDQLVRVRHPRLCEVRDLFEVAAAVGPPFRLVAGDVVLLETWVDGRRSDAALAELTDAAREAAVLRLGADVARALAALHDARIVHGDVKPANVVVDPDLGSATLVDLGLAGAPGQRGAFEGTPSYLAPEARAGLRSVSTDLYALGATLFDWLDGGAALAGAGAGASRTASDDDAGPLGPARRALAATDSPALRALVHELLAPVADDRPRSSREVLRRLEEAAGRSPSNDTLLDAASPADRALAASTLPLVGRDAALRALALALATPGVVRLEGPSGAGKTRLFHEAARAQQAATAARGGILPRVIEAHAVFPETGPSAIVLCTAELDEADAWARVRAAELAGERLVIALERARGREAGTRSVELAPLDRPELAALLAHLCPDAPVRGAALDAAMRACLGAPGRLVRAVASAWDGGDDPMAPGVLERHAGDTHAPLAWPRELAPLRRALAIAGGTLDAHLALAAGLDLGGARRLAAAGLASFDGERLSVRDAEVRAARAEPETRADRSLAARLSEGAGRPEERAYAWLVLDRARGEVESLRALLDLRLHGDVDAAARLAEIALAELERPGTALVCEAMDALRAAGDLAAALAAGRGRAELEVRVLSAELERLRGAAAEGEALAEALGAAPGAVSVRARIRLDHGDRAAAAALARDALSHPDTARDPIVRARLEETLAFAAPTEAARAEHARELRRTLGELEAATHLPAHARTLARARVVSVLGTLAGGAGRTVEAAALHAESASLAREMGERVAASRFAANVGVASLDLGRLGPAIDALTDAARRMTLAREEAGLGRVLYNLSSAYGCAGDLGRADAFSARALEVAERTGDRAAVALARVVRADVELHAGRPLVARAELERALALGPPPAEEVVVESRLGVVLASLGRGAEARALVALALARESSGAAAELEAVIAAGRVELSLGSIEPALAYARDAARRSEGAGGFEGRSRSLSLLEGALEAAGRSAEAQATLAELARLYDDALRSLRPAAQAKLRAHPPYRRALAVLPASAPALGEQAREGEGVRVLRAAALVAREDRPRRVLSALARAALELSAAERAFVVERGPGGALSVPVAVGGAGALPSDERPSLSVASRALDRREPVRTTDALSDLALLDAASVHSMALRSVLALPLPSSGDGLERALVLDDRVRPGAFASKVTESLAALAELAGVAFARAEALRADRLDRVRSRRRERALERRLEAGLAEAAPPGAPAFVARSEAMRAALEIVARAAPSALPVLLVGETGTGKELLARTLAARSGRAGPFVVASASALPESLLESALFGHVRGAFTGADRAQRGLFEAADGGTLFLDEVGTASPALQAKLLRVLESGEIRPVGATRARSVSVRLVSASRLDLEELVRDGAFREDLYWRLAVVTVRVPPLRERPEDVAELVRAIVARLADGAAPRVDAEALAALSRHPWPGNVRELENELSRALLAVSGGRGTIGLEHLSLALRGDPGAPESLDLRAQTDALERRLVRRALELSGQNQTHAARALGVSRFGLSKMMARLGLSRLT